MAKKEVRKTKSVFEITIEKNVSHTYRVIAENNVEAEAEVLANYESLIAYSSYDSDFEVKEIDCVADEVNA